MINMMIFALSMVVSPNVTTARPVKAVSAQVSQCETYKPNLAGISVTVCSGEVVSRCDQSGNCLFSASTY